MIHLNKSKCTNCNKCVKICPFGALNAAKGYPALVEGKKCLECYHCVAICPVSAMTSDQDQSESPKHDMLNKEFYDQLELLVKIRRSVRNYKEAPVPKAVIESILDTVKMCPTAKNQQSARWITVSGKDKTDKIMKMVLNFTNKSGISPEIKECYDEGKNVVTLNAPSLLIVYSDKNVIAPQIDCTIALTTAELLLQAQGIGTCHAGYLRRISNDSDEIRNYIGLPNNCEIYGIIAMGYPDEDEYLQIPERNNPQINWI